MIDLWQEIYSTIVRNKLRTLLTGFAVAWGIFILIVLLGAGNGIMHAFAKQSGRRATNSIKIYGGTTSKPFDGLKEGREIRLNTRDLELSTQQLSDHVEGVSATLFHNNAILKSASDYFSTGLQGVHPLQLELESTELVEGRFINALDVEQRRKVIVLHERTAEILFDRKHSRAVGSVLMVDQAAFLVVGIYKDSFTGNENAFVPFSTLQTIYNKGDVLSSLVLKTKGLDTPAKNEAFEERYYRMAGAHHRFDASDKSALWIWNRFTSHLQEEKGMSLLRTAIWVIGLFTLLSGIVGVSNIMLITVKERTREFGIRKALGAKPRSILRLIILESVAITTFFGYIGLVAGVAATEWMNLAYGSKSMNIGVNEITLFVDPTVDIGIALQATLTLVAAGTLAGLVPARRAARIRPIEALRVS
ncbi:MAG: ABC transporter permease [Bacteroides sp.]|nr:ABC transporter permease [Bacteroides sp.]